MRGAKFQNGGDHRKLFSEKTTLLVKIRDCHLSGCCLGEQEGDGKNSYINEALKSVVQSCFSCICNSYFNIC